MIKIHYFLDHPIQYQNPFLDKLSLSKEIDLKVIYLSDFSLKPYFLCINEAVPSLGKL